MLSKLKFSNCLVLLIGSVIQAIGIYNIHSLSNVTEGGVLGLTLLLQHWFQISPAVSSLEWTADAEAKTVDIRLALSALTEAGLTLDDWRRSMPAVARRSRTVPIAPGQAGRVLHALAESCPEAQMGGVIIDQVVKMSQPFFRQSRCHFSLPL